MTIARTALIAPVSVIEPNSVADAVTLLAHRLPSPPTTKR